MGARKGWHHVVAEHVENANVRSCDATLLLPAQKLGKETHRRVKANGQQTCWALKISGPFDAPGMCRGNEVRVIECNPLCLPLRALRLQGL